jgi:galactokinase
VEAFSTAVSEKYRQQFGLQAEVLACRAADGAQVIRLR